MKPSLSLLNILIVLFSSIKTRMLLRYVTSVIFRSTAGFLCGPAKFVSGLTGGGGGGGEHFFAQDNFLNDDF